MEVELIFSYVDEKSPVQEEADRQLLEKIKKYGMFDENGEWINES